MNVYESEKISTTTVLSYHVFFLNFLHLTNTKNKVTQYTSKYINLCTNLEQNTDNAANYSAIK